MSQYSHDDLLLGRVKWEDLAIEHKQNLTVLLDRLNRFAQACPLSLKINDAFRRPSDQPRNAAVHSKHLTGQAVDLDDDDSGTLWHWTLDNLRTVIDIGFWMENPCWTHGSVGTWMHYQIVPPPSGRRIFIPNGAPPSAPYIWNGDYPKGLP